MSVPEKLDVLDMLINVLNEHEKRFGLKRIIIMRVPSGKNKQL